VKNPSPSAVSPVSPPIQKTYICNTTNYQCEPPTPGHGSSKEVCVENCKNRPPVPPVILGKFRGLQIDNRYIVAEWQLDVTTAGYNMFFNGSFYQSGQMWAGSKVGHINIKIEAGAQAGTAQKGYYTVSQGMAVEHMLIAIGSDANDDPTGWDTPWILGGENGQEFVWTRFVSAE